MGKFIVLLGLCSTVAAALLFASVRHEQGIYLGFDSNDYPGDAALTELHKTFSYTGYWLNLPPGWKRNTWTGKRAAIEERGFGFLLLYNGRFYRELRKLDDVTATGRKDATEAVASAEREGFRHGAVIFLDQEEGGVLLPEQFAYIEAWTDAVRAAGYAPGVYCSGLASDVEEHQQSPSITTAADLRAKLGNKRVMLWVANDECPPSPGCSYGKPLPPSTSGETDALVWQFAQSPRRKQFTAGCAATYAADGMCYAPGLPPGDSSLVDLNSSTSPDPSHGR